jgi:hypothetical protein
MNNLENQLPCQEELDDIELYLSSDGVSMLDNKFKEVEDLLSYWRSILEAI